MILPYKDKYPEIRDSSFIASSAVVTGDVKIGEKTSIWYGCVIRGDVAPTVIGDGVNIQDNSILHQAPNVPLIIEDGVTVGHNVVLHACTIRKNALIGISSTVLDNVEIGEGAIVAAGSVVPPNKKIPPKTLVIGAPAKVSRELTEEEVSELNRIRSSYVEIGQYYKDLEKKYLNNEEGV